MKKIFKFLLIALFGLSFTNLNVIKAADSCDNEYYSKKEYYNNGMVKKESTFYCYTSYDYTSRYSVKEDIYFDTNGNKTKDYNYTHYFYDYEYNRKNEKTIYEYKNYVKVNGQWVNLYESYINQENGKTESAHWYTFFNNKRLKTKIEQYENRKTTINYNASGHKLNERNQQFSHNHWWTKQYISYKNKKIVKDTEYKLNKKGKAVVSEEYKYHANGRLSIHKEYKLNKKNQNKLIRYESRKSNKKKNFIKIYKLNKYGSAKLVDYEKYFSNGRLKESKRYELNKKGQSKLINHDIYYSNGKKKKNRYYFINKKGKNIIWDLTDYYSNGKVKRNVSYTKYKNLKSVKW